MIDISVRNLTKFFVIGENLLEGLSFEIQEGGAWRFWAGMVAVRPRFLRS